MLRSILSITPSWLGGTGFHNLPVRPWKIGHYRLASLLFIARGKEQRQQKFLHDLRSHLKVTLSGTGRHLSIFEYQGISKKKAK